MTTIHTITSSPTDKGQRLDKFLSAHLPGLSRSRLQSLIEQGHVRENAASVTDASHKVKPGYDYVVHVPAAIPSHIEPQAMALTIVFEDEHMLILNKPPGLTVHPGAGNPDHTLVNALLAHCGASLSGIGGVARPGIVHRIDKDTSGLLVVAKRDEAHHALSAQLASRSLKRTYQALVWGTPAQKSGTITGNIGRSVSNRQKMAVVKTGGKAAVTHYKLVKTFHNALFALLEFNLETGRTHQIRVHATHIGHPIIGDPVYGQATAQRLKSGLYKSLPDATRESLLRFNRQALHAKELALLHPASGKPMHFSCDLPDDMEELMTALSL